MYTKAELFTMAAEQQKEIFSNNITLSAPDDASDCIDLDAEKARRPASGSWRTCL